MRDITVKFENVEGAWQREPVKRENATVLTERVEIIG